MSKLPALILAALLAAALLLTGCSGDDDSPSGAASLDGSWGGTIESSSGALGTITVSISGSSITVSTPDGTFSGTISHETGSVYGFIIDGTDGGFMIDSSATHAAFVDETFVFGVVQKGAGGPTGSYSPADLTGSWAGSYAETDVYFDLVGTGTAQASVAGDLSFSGSSSAPDNFNGSFTIYDGSYGRYIGSVTSSAGTTGVAAFLTPDKQFAGSYSCFGFPECTFNYWRKQ